MKFWYPFLNPVEWINAFKFNRRNAKFDKSTYDLELFLYSKILNNNMLHWGYFEDINIKPETISLQQLEDAQIKYSQNIIEQIVDINSPVLDVGCGMGGLAGLMLNKIADIEVLTPNKSQIDYISNKYKNITRHNCKFEKFESNRKFGTIINSESLQYISLNDAFNKTDEIVLPDGRWIVVDYFRLNDNGIDRRPHLLKDFNQKIKDFGWRIVYERDITLNVLPTISYANFYVDRILLPIKHYAYEKLRYKKAWLYYLTNKLRISIDNKIDKEKASIDPFLFTNEKKYMFFVLKKITTGKI